MLECMLVRYPYIFKTGPFNRSGTPPFVKLLSLRGLHHSCFKFGGKSASGATLVPISCLEFEQFADLKDVRVIVLVQ